MQKIANYINHVDARLHEDHGYVAFFRQKTVETGVPTSRGQRKCFCTRCIFVGLNAISSRILTPTGGLSITTVQA